MKFIGYCNFLPVHMFYLMRTSDEYQSGDKNVTGMVITEFTKDSAWRLFNFQMSSDRFLGMSSFHEKINFQLYFFI